ncbi:hypothetical protein CORC01_03023 [Colletotrichum orchidophilum]|uniref:Uncharacterized protein n=1 Tax=Colletotrichum orchidophilum TaxID=1209926 RepID=A0A1G4BK65_9PEZI|nr:uncharacterized protein CORC01_03023 [Colletotrichum orchidophilum]OHF01832.1 hypothetical protein CORC01_03023 [Colletotrichum orchidophilum]
MQFNIASVLIVMSTFSLGAAHVRLEATSAVWGLIARLMCQGDPLVLADTRTAPRTIPRARNLFNENFKESSLPCEITDSSSYGDQRNLLNRSKTTTAISNSDHEHVTKTVRYHVDSVVKADSALLDLALTTTSMHSWAHEVRALFFKTRYDVIGIIPTDSLVKVDMENTPDAPAFTDFRPLIKVDGGRRIIAKILHAYDCWIIQTTL